MWCWRCSSSPARGGTTCAKEDMRPRGGDEQLPFWCCLWASWQVRGAFCVWIVFSWVTLNHSFWLFQACSPKHSAWGSWDHAGKTCNSTQGAQCRGTDSASRAATTLSSDKRLPIVVPGRRKLARLLSRSEPVLGGPCPTLTTGVAQVGAASQAPLSPCFTPA